MPSNRLPIPRRAVDPGHLGAAVRSTRPGGLYQSRQDDQHDRYRDGAADARRDRANGISCMRLAAVRMATSPCRPGAVAAFTMAVSIDTCSAICRPRSRSPSAPPPVEMMVRDSRLNAATSLSTASADTDGEEQRIGDRGLEEFEARSALLQLRRPPVSLQHTAMNSIDTGAGPNRRWPRTPMR